MIKFALLFCQTTAAKNLLTLFNDAVFLVSSIGDMKEIADFYFAPTMMKGC